MSLPFDSAHTRAILLDIEGTTTPIDFVHKTLFPFASKHLEEFLSTHIEDNEIRMLVDEIGRYQQRDMECDEKVRTWHDETGGDRVISASSYVRWLIARDSKISPLKSLEGKIWEEGYRSGELRSTVYPDVPRALTRWHAQGRRLAVFSSGSVLAQKLLFSYSAAGDLTVFFDGFFDTTTGPKRDPGSYRRIAAKLEVATREALFVSDVTAELDAARVAGMQTGLALRPDAPKPATSNHPTVLTFDNIFP